MLFTYNPGLTKTRFTYDTAYKNYSTHNPEPKQQCLQSVEVAVTVEIV